MNWPWAIVAVVGLIVLGVVADWHERRADRRLRDIESAAEHRRLMREIDDKP